jgi:hypothetical protein
MALTITQAAWGYCISCSGGTTVPVLISASPNDSIKIAGIACGGAATTDITTIQDAQGNLVFKGASVVNTMNTLPLAAPVRLTGLYVGFAGATTGYCNVYISVGVI